MGVISQTLRYNLCRPADSINYLLSKMTAKGQKKFGELLVQKGLLAPVQLQIALEEQERTGEFLGEILLKKNYIREDALTEVLSAQFGIPVVKLSDRYINWKIVDGFSASVILDYRCFPVARDDWSVTVAITNPLDARVLARAQEGARGQRLKFVLVSRKDMDEVLARYKQYRKGNIARKFKNK